MNAYNSRIAQRLHHPPDQFAVFLRHGKSDRIRQIHRPCARRNHRLRYLLQVIRIGARRIFRRELDIIAILASQPNSRNRILKHLLASLLQLVLFKWNIASRKKRIRIQGRRAFFNA